MSIKLVSTSGGSVTIQEPNTASDFTLSVPAQTANILTNKTAGTILQVVQTPFTAAYSSTTSEFTNVSGFSATITPTSASSKILVHVALGKVATTYASNNTILFRLTRNGSAVLVGDASGSRPRGAFSMMRSNPNADHTMGLSWSGYDSPSSTSALTYQLQAWSEGGFTYYINRSENNSDANESYRGQAYSQIVLMEVAG